MTEPRQTKYLEVEQFARWEYTIDIFRTLDVPVAPLPHGKSVILAARGSLVALCLAQIGECGQKEDPRPTGETMVEVVHGIGGDRARGLA